MYKEKWNKLELNNFMRIEGGTSIQWYKQGKEEQMTAYFENGQRKHL